MKKITIPALMAFALFTNCSQNGDTYTDNLGLSESEALELDESYSTEEALAFVESDYKKDVGNGKNEIGTDDLQSENVYNTKIIRNADLKLKVEDVKKSSAKIANLVDMNGGYISSEELNSSKNYYQTIERSETSEIVEYEVVTTNIIYIRVPSKNFQPLLTSMKGLSISEDYVNITAQDVTEEYFDLETRLKTKKEVEARYIDILKSKAKTVEDILLAEDKIRVIREEIEAVEGRLKYLQNKVSLSTIQVEIYQDPYFITETTNFKAYERTGWSFGESASDAISTGWNGILMFFIGILYLWPIWLIGFIVFWLIRRKIRQIRAKK